MVRIVVVQTWLRVKTANGTTATRVRFLVIGVFGLIVVRVHFVEERHTLLHGRIFFSAGGWFGIAANIATATTATIAPINWHNLIVGGVATFH